MKAIDVVKEPARTAFEDWERWQNWIYSQLLTMPYRKKTIIEVKQETN